MTWAASPEVLGAQLGRRMFDQADRAWQEHLTVAPEEVADLLQYFERLRTKAGEIDREADVIGASRVGLGVVFRRSAKEAFRAASERSVTAMINEWRDLADRDHDIFDQVTEKYVPAASHALIFPNDPPAALWDPRMYALLHDAFRTLAYHVGLEAPDRPPPVRAALSPTSGLNRHQRRAWARQHGRATA